MGSAVNNPSPLGDTITESEITLADNTTNNSSTTKHGFLKKLDNVSTNFMNGQGNWAAPAAGIGGSTGATDNALLAADGAGGGTRSSGRSVHRDKKL